MNNAHPNLGFVRFLTGHIRSPWLVFVRSYSFIIGHIMTVAFFVLGVRIVVLDFLVLFRMGSIERPDTFAE